MATGLTAVTAHVLKDAGIPIADVVADTRGRLTLTGHHSCDDCTGRDLSHLIRSRSHAIVTADQMRTIGRALAISKSSYRTYISAILTRLRHEYGSDSGDYDLLAFAANPLRVLCSLCGYSLGTVAGICWGMLALMERNAAVHPFDETNLAVIWRALGGYIAYVRKTSAASPTVTSPIHAEATLGLRDYLRIIRDSPEDSRFRIYLIFAVLRPPAGGEILRARWRSAVVDVVDSDDVVITPDCVVSRNMDKTGARDIPVAVHRHPTNVRRLLRRYTDLVRPADGDCFFAQPGVLACKTVASIMRRLRTEYATWIATTRSPYLRSISPTELFSNPRHRVVVLDQMIQYLRVTEHPRTADIRQALAYRMMHRLSSAGAVGDKTAPAASDPLGPWCMRTVLIPHADEIYSDIGISSWYVDMVDNVLDTYDTSVLYELYKLDIDKADTISTADSLHRPAILRDVLAHRSRLRSRADRLMDIERLALNLP